VTTQLTWAQRARNWSIRCSVTLPGCPWAMRLIERKTEDDIKTDVMLVQAGLMGALAELRRRDASDDITDELLERIHEAEELLFQLEHRRVE
jgi:hypothetical protein